MKNYLAAIAICLLFFEQDVHAGPAAGKPTSLAALASDTSAPNKNYPLGEFVIGFCPALTEDAGTLIRQQQSFGLPGIDALNTKHRVNAAGALIPAYRGKTLSEKQTLRAERFKNYRRRFPNRTLRAVWPAAKTPEEAALRDDTNDYLFKTPVVTDPKTVCAEYASDPCVRYCHPNYVGEIAWVPNDTYYGTDDAWPRGAGQNFLDLWPLEHIQAETSWDIAQGSGVVVAVIDSGVDYNHLDLNDPMVGSNMWQNEQETQNGVDDGDQNSLIDDIQGWDFTTCTTIDGNNNCVGPKQPDNNPIDDLGHGTHVAGIIAALGDNNRGIIGVAPQAQIMPIKATTQNGKFKVAELAAALEYAIQAGADVANISLYQTSPGSVPAVEQQIFNAYQEGMVVVFAAGNSRLPVTDVAFVNLPQVIAVASTDAAGQRSSFSHYVDPSAAKYQGIIPPVNADDPAIKVDDYHNVIDLAAPGGEGVVAHTGCAPAPYWNILSLRAGTTAFSVAANGCTAFPTSTFVVGGTYYRGRGTSMSAAYVSGAAALLLSYRPTLGSAEARGTVAEILRESADNIIHTVAHVDRFGAPLPSLEEPATGWDRFTGMGRLNIRQALFLADEPPVLSGVPEEAVSLYPGETIEFFLSATDADDTLLTLSATTGNEEPVEALGASFIDNGDATGAFAWTPGPLQAGQYFITFSAHDGNRADAKILEVNVLADTAAPYTSETFPNLGGYSSTDALLEFHAMVHDDVGLMSATLRLDGRVIATFNLQGTTEHLHYIPQEPMPKNDHVYSLVVYDQSLNSLSLERPFHLFSGGGGSCFLAGTSVRLGDGTTKSIEEIQVGDRVIAYNEETKKFERRSVKHFFAFSEQKEHLVINGHIRVTPTHRFLLGGKWIPAGELKVGDALLNDRGEQNNITSIEHVAEPKPVFNFEVAELHNFVAEGVVVHNMVGGGEK